MKRFALLISLFALLSSKSYSQAEEIEQLLLDWEKLTQFKAILKDMKDGYEILEKGYSAIRDISSGNFSLHKGFLDGLMEVSPAVKKYKRIVDIIDYQLRIVDEYKKAFRQFRDEKVLSVFELEHIARVYSNLFGESLKTLDELLMVITAGTLRMSDDERLGAIDKVFENIQGQYLFLRKFNGSTGSLVLQRKAEQAEINLSKIIDGNLKQGVHE